MNANFAADEDWLIANLDKQFEKDLKNQNCEKSKSFLSKYYEKADKNEEKKEIESKKVQAYITIEKPPAHKDEKYIIVDTSKSFSLLLNIIEKKDENYGGENDTKIYKKLKLLNSKKNTNSNDIIIGRDYEKEEVN